MKFKEFMKDLDGGLKHVYLLTGKEKFYIDKALEKILSKLKITRQDIFTIDFKDKMPITDVVNAIDTAPFFSKYNVVLVRNATFFSADGKFDSLEKVLNNMMPENYVIFVAESPDKRRKLYRTVSKIAPILEAEPLRAWEVSEWLNEKLKSLGKNMDGQARRFFLERIELLPEISLWYLENEMNKIAEFVGDKDITAAALQKIMTEPPELSNFVIIDAINNKQSEKAVMILRNSLRDVSKMPLIIGLLVKNIRQFMTAKIYLKRGASDRDLVKPLEVPHPYIAQKIANASKSYSPRILEETFLELADLDFNFKTGRAGAEALEKIVIKLCRR
ncbi:MAG: DNA polymerase III subunit delta [Selenomonadaceae bacterium]|nr:DNA polymerase III subunit delta [Selenomonadaceae bacterium]